jgi:hypothetical protein
VAKAVQVSAELLEDTLIDKERGERRGPAVLRADRAAFRGLSTGDGESGYKRLGYGNRGNGNGVRERRADAFMKEAKAFAIIVCVSLSWDVRGRSGPLGTAEVAGDIRGPPSGDAKGADEGPVVRGRPPERVFHIESSGGEDRAAEEKMIDGVDRGFAEIMCGRRRQT